MSSGVGYTEIEVLREIVRSVVGMLPDSGVVTAVGLDKVDVRLASSGQLLRGVPAIGGVSGLAAGDAVQLLFLGDRPFVLSTKAVSGGAPASGGAAHSHDGRYYTEDETDAKLALKADAVHEHGQAGDVGGFRILDEGLLSSEGGLLLAKDGRVIFGVDDGDDQMVLESRQATTHYIWAGGASPASAKFSLKKNGDAFIKAYVESHMLDLELMKMAFQSISWAQFAVWDSFDDEAKRASPDPSTYDARVFQGKLDNGEDDTADREFGFVSNTYADITSVYAGTSTGVGAGYLDDTAAEEWFTDKYKGYQLVDSASSVFSISGNTATRLNLASGTPAAGAYTIRSVLPGYCVAFCAFDDSTQNGGYGTVKLEASFDGGANWQTLLDTEAGTNNLEATVAIADPGRDYAVRFTLTNDAQGRGPVVHKFLLCTDPSVWQ